jgi:aminoglycoside phosphotransferase (APT) family kinase protein
VRELKIQELLDRATLAADARWPGASLTDIEPLHGGISSLTFAARLCARAEPDQRVVVKVAPPGLAPVRNRDVLRQAKVLRALHGAPGVNVPEVLLEDAGAPPFFVMGYVEGQAYEPKKDVAADPPSPEVVAYRARAAAQMLAWMHHLDPPDVGLGDEPPIPLAQELERWARLFSTAGHDLRHDEAELHRQLEASVPDSVAPKVLHGDYRLGNMQFAGACLAAIIDWEIWSLGDPRSDLAWLMVWSDPVQKFHRRRDEPNTEAGAGMPSADALLAEYRAINPVDFAVPDLAWFTAACRYKMASTTAVLVKQSRRRPEPDPRLETAATTLPAIVARGLSDLRGGA